MSTDLQERALWALSEGVEVEGRYTGLQTLFANAAAETPGMCAKMHRALRAGWFDQYAHLYISRDLSMHPGWKALAMDWYWRFSGMRPVTLAVYPQDVPKIGAQERVCCHVQVVLWPPLKHVSDIIGGLKPTDELVVVQRELCTYSWAVGDAGYTEPTDYALDREVTLEQLEQRHRQATTTTEENEP